MKEEEEKNGKGWKKVASIWHRIEGVEKGGTKRVALY